MLEAQCIIVGLVEPGRKSMRLLSAAEYTFFFSPYRE
jgi:hypothetical protein